MKTIKEAADNLLSKNEIDKDQYSLIKESGLFEEKELTKEAISKWNRFLVGAKKAIKPIKLTGTGAIVTGAGIVAGKELAYDPIKSKIQISKSFDQLKDKVPQLKEKDDNDIKDYFSVVKSFSPKAAANPLVAGALVNKMMEFGGVDHKLVQDISAIESGLRGSSVLDPITSAATKTITNI